MSASPSESLEYDYESAPDSPGAPSARPWRYLEHPDDDEWMRGPSETQTWPSFGDFVVLSLNPVASVRHLDAAAQEEARQIPVRKFVAAAVGTVGLPIDEKALHPYDYLFVRQGKPSPRLPGRNPEDVYVAIEPDTTTNESRAPICPAHPLPWPDCYFDLTWGFPYECRSTNVTRDYFPVLPMNNYELLRVHHYVQEGFAYARQKYGADRPDPLSFVDVSEDIVPVTLIPPQTSPSGPQQLDSRPSAIANDDPDDDVSIIASEDHADDDDYSISDSHSQSDTDDEELNMLLQFEAMMKNQGDLRDPVVDTWYDLDMVDEITDPILFLRDVKRLKSIMDAAEARLRARAAAPLPHEMPTTSVRDDDPGLGGTPGAAPSLAHSGADTGSHATSPPAISTDVPARSPPSDTSSKRKLLRSYLKTLSTKLAVLATMRIRKLIRASPEAQLVCKEYPVSFSSLIPRCALAIGRLLKVS
ncbi:unnamed protein product [Peniophora sp. CBMAI 1063]|nr:unnamed protein product [Peniophora sp. CBMAI 1063]